MVNQITVLVIQILAVTCIYCETDTKQNDMEDIENVLTKYFDKLPNVESKYVINEGISKMISKYFDGRVNAFPLFKVSVEIDRKPVKIPWTLDRAEKMDERKLKKRYKYMKAESTTNK